MVVSNHYSLRNPVNESPDIRGRTFTVRLVLWAVIRTPLSRRQYAMHARSILLSSIHCVYILTFIFLSARLQLGLVFAGRDHQFRANVLVEVGFADDLELECGLLEG